MKKVLLVATVQSHICQFHKPLVDVLHKMDCEVHVAAYDNLATKKGLKLDFVEKVYNLPFARSPKDTSNIKAYKMLKIILDENNYDVVHCNTPMGGIVTRLAAKAVHKRGTKVIYTAHGFHFYNGAPWKNWFFFYPVEKFFSTLTDVIITITQEDYKLACDKFDCKIEYIHGVGVDERRYFQVSEEEKLQLRDKMGYSATQKLILCIGELNANKNQIMAIKAMHKVVEKFPDALLILAGNGPMEKFLKEVIKQEGLDMNVQMIGYVSNLQDYQHVIDVQVCCSHREGLPLNVVESMMSGNPVVAGLNRGHRELIHDNDNGFLVAQNDSNALAEKVLFLLEDKSEYERIRANARKSAMQYGYVNVKRELNAIYSKFINL